MYVPDRERERWLDEEIARHKAAEDPGPVGEAEARHGNALVGGSHTALSSAPTGTGSRRIFLPGPNR